MCACHVVLDRFFGDRGALAKLAAAEKTWQAACGEATSVYDVDITQAAVIEAIGADVVAAATGANMLNGM